jgi:hypothetical protein
MSESTEKPISVRIPKETLSQIHAFEFVRNQTRTEIIQVAITEFITNHYEEIRKVIECTQL